MTSPSYDSGWSDMMPRNGAMDVGRTGQVEETDPYRPDYVTAT